MRQPLYSLGRPATAAIHAAEIRKLHRAGIGKSEIARGYRSAAPRSGESWEQSHEKTQARPAREDRIHNEAIVDAGPEEQAMGWHCYLESKIRFPFPARCIAAKDVSPLRKGETTEVVRMAPEDVCAHDMLVQIRWQGRKMAVPLSQLAAIDPRRIDQGSHRRLALLGRAGLLFLSYARPTETSRISELICRAATVEESPWPCGPPRAYEPDATAPENQWLAARLRQNGY